MSARPAFRGMVEHLDALRQELVTAGFGPEERAAVLGAEARSWHLDMKVIPELECFLVRSGFNR